MASNQNYSREADDAYEAQNDTAGDVSGELNDDSYISGKSDPVPVTRDTDSYDDPTSQAEQDSDSQLEQDEREAISESNMIESRTRGAEPTGSYSEGPDEDDLPAEVVDGSEGRSSNY